MADVKFDFKNLAHYSCRTSKPHPITRLEDALLDTFVCLVHTQTAWYVPITLPQMWWRQCSFVNSLFIHAENHYSSTFRTNHKRRLHLYCQLYTFACLPSKLLKAEAKSQWQLAFSKHCGYTSWTNAQQDWKNSCAGLCSCTLQQSCSFSWDITCDCQLKYCVCHSDQPDRCNKQTVDAPV